MKYATHAVLDALRLIPLQDAPNEVWITQRLASVLHEGRSEVPYPGRSWSCDVRYRNETGGFTWIELKYAQPYSSQSRLFDDNRRNFEKVLSGTAVHDVVDKLPAIAAAGPDDRIGFVLILYYHQLGQFALPLGRVETFRQATGISRGGWAEYHTGAWPNPNIANPVCMIDVYYWERAIDHFAIPCGSALQNYSQLLALVADYTAFEQRASRLLRVKYLPQDSSDWTWELWVADVLQLEAMDPLVVEVGDRVRQSEGRFDKASYSQMSRVEKLISTLDGAVRLAVRRRQP